MYLVYSLLLGLAAIVLTPYWLVQGIRRKKYLSNLSERLGLSFPALERLPLERPGAVWLHAVSVGEVLAGVTLARRLKEEFPGRPLVVSTTTITGQGLAKERMPFADAVIYFPLDWQFCVRRALTAVKPALVVVLETEIWPNFLRVASENNVPVLFISGRISDRSFARSQSWLTLFGFYLRPFWKDALGRAAGFWMQSEKDAERVKALGARAANVHLGGNLKYDLELPKTTPLADWLEGEIARDGRRPVIVAGSVVATEEPLALIAFGVVQGEHRKALLVLAPRKPERFEAAAQFIEDSHQKWIRRSNLRVTSPSGQHASGSETAMASDVAVLLLDSIGELASLYRLADGVLVGGSLVESGGHNILEPAAFGKVPVFGESMENFAEMAERFVTAEAALQVGSPEDAGVVWIELLRNVERNKKMGETARRLVEDSRGATERAVTAIRAELDNPHAAG
ncbi:MAG TPA: glycosyltransferase N-terminal domain-containing protein [Candidatus Eisenbacteria bacterium]|nr:glycosyltransferase N-terminal domain-containing protein [Candidatus Eisenbacteria bacterium]